MADQGPTQDVNVFANTDYPVIAGEIAAQNDKTLGVEHRTSNGAPPLLQAAENFIPPPPPPPGVVNQNPAPGTTIIPSQTVAFDITGVTGPYCIALVYPSGHTEMVWDGQAFAAAFVTGSTPPGVGPIQHMVVKRAGGWPESPTFLVPVGGKLG